jgi:endoglucanase
MAGAVLDAAAARLGGEIHLTAGEWAHGDQVVVNPSYLDPASFDFLARHTGDGRWAALAESSRRTLARLTDGSLPPDWAVLTADGIEPISSPDAGTEPARFSFDALRVPLRLATSCTGSLAAGMEAVWPRVQANPAVAVRHLDGTAAEEWEHPAALVGAAALAYRFEPALVRPLLARAARGEAEAPSYYGAALTALGRLLLTTDTLQRCP